MTNIVTPHDVRPVDTTVGELEPGTVFRESLEHLWKIRLGGCVATAAYLIDGAGLCVSATCPVVEIADSVTIEREVSDA